LSSARAIAVLELLAERFDLAPARMAVAGYADTAPVSSNDTDEGRARNRRVDIVVLSRGALQKEPGGIP
jgi:chemotaxis protein MotB